MDSGWRPSPWGQIPGAGHARRPRQGQCLGLVREGTRVRGPALGWVLLGGLPQHLGWRGTPRKPWTARSLARRSRWAPLQLGGHFSAPCPSFAKGRSCRVAAATECHGASFSTSTGYNHSVFLTISLWPLAPKLRPRVITEAAGNSPSKQAFLSHV